MKRLFGFTFVFLIVMSLTINTSVLAAYNGNTNNQSNVIVFVLNSPPAELNNMNWMNKSIFFRINPVQSNVNKANAKGENLNVDIGQAVLSNNIGNLAVVGNWQTAYDVTAAQVNLQNFGTQIDNYISSDQAQANNINRGSNATLQSKENSFYIVIGQWNNNFNPWTNNNYFNGSGNLWKNNHWLNNSMNSTGASNIIIVAYFNDSGQMEQFYNLWQSLNGNNTGVTSVNISDAYNDTGQLMVLNNDSGQEGSNSVNDYNAANLNNNYNNIQLVNNIAAAVLNGNSRDLIILNELQVAETARSAPTYSLNVNNYMMMNLTASAAMKPEDVNLQPQINLLI